MSDERRRRKLLWTLIATLIVSIIGVNFAAFGTSNAPVSVNIYLPVISNNQIGSPSVLGAEVVSAFNAGSGVDAMLQAGATWLRYNGLDWSLIQPTKTTYNWSYVDTLKSQLAVYQGKPYNLILVVRNTPAWARPQPYATSVCGPIMSTEYNSFASFMKKLVSELSVPPYNVKYWEIGNEPDAPINSTQTIFGCWGGWFLTNYGGNAYGEMLRVVYPAIKAADPNAKVIVGGLLLDHPIIDPSSCPTNTRSEPGCFLLGVMANGNGAFFDGVAYHSYDYYRSPGDYYNPTFKTDYSTGPVPITKEAYVRTLLAQGGYPDKPVLNTETSLLCSVNCDTGFQATKAAYVAIVYASAIADRIPMRIWYDVFGSWRNNGLMSTLSKPLPAYDAFTFAATELGHASYGKTLTQPTIPAGVAGYEFTSNGRTIWLLWTNDLSSHTITLPRTPTYAYSTTGGPLSLTQKPTLNYSPVYFEWNGTP